MKVSVLISFLIISSFSTASYAQDMDTDSLDEYHVFIFDLIEKVNYGNYEPFINSINKERIIEQVFEDIDSNNPNVSDFKKGMLSGISKQMGGTYSQLFEESDLLEYVNYNEVGDYYSVLVRITGNSGVNYLELQLEKDVDGKISIIDIYPFLAGEFLTSTLNRLAQMFLNENSLLDQITGADKKEKELLESLQKIITIRNYNAEGLFKESVDLYESFPESVKNNKLFIITVLPAASEISDDYYLSVIDRYNKYYPDDPGLPLMVLDAYLLRGKIDESLEMVDRLDEAVGGDNYLNYLRGSILIIGERNQKAKEYLNLTIENDIYREEAYWSLVELNLSEKNYDEVISLLDKLSFIFDYEFTSDGFSEEPYLEFSESFKDWINNQ